MRTRATMKRLLPWLVAAILLLAFVLFIASMFHMGTGSRRYARKWRKQLLACQSLEEVKRHFNCFAFEDGPKIALTKSVLGQPRTLVKGFPDGQWIACAYGDSHGGRGGGTIVTRDSSGEIHVFFGHVCGDLFVNEETLEKFYTSLRDYCHHFGGKEVFP